MLDLRNYPPKCKIRMLPRLLQSGSGLHIYLGCFGVADDHAGVLDASELRGSCRHPWYSRFARGASFVYDLLCIPIRTAIFSEMKYIAGGWCDEGVAERGQEKQ